MAPDRQVTFSARIPVAVLGATGSVGQRFVALLHGHPWFELTAVAASERSAGKRYRDAVRWMQSSPLPRAIADLEVVNAGTPSGVALVFSALDADVAGPIEETWARAGALVVSNAKSHRYDADVPLVVPEVNGDHLALVREQRYGRGAIITNPNCSTIGLTLALKPLADAFGLSRIHVVTLQAISGAGLPGVPSYEILDNVVPFISGEEEKIQRETRKILGRLDGNRVQDAEIVVSAQCNRVPVVDGHTECVSIELGRRASLEEVRDALADFTAEPQALGLPSAPERPVHLHAADAHPQPRLHRDLDRGMATSVGRLRPCEILDYKFVLLSHNTIRGAAGGALLAAELAIARGLLAEHPASSVVAAR